MGADSSSSYFSQLLDDHVTRSARLAGVFDLCGGSKNLPNNHVWVNQHPADVYDREVLYSSATSGAEERD